MIKHYSMFCLSLLGLFNLSLQAMVELQTNAAINAIGQDALNQKLVATIKNPSHIIKSIAQVQQYLKLGADPNAQDTDGTPALLLAAQTQNIFYCLSLTKVLLYAGADINAQDQWGYTALLRAAKLQRADLAAWLLFNNADKDIINNDNECYDDVALTRFVKDVNTVLAHCKKTYAIQKNN